MMPLLLKEFRIRTEELVFVLVGLAWWLIAYFILEQWWTIES